MREYLTPDHPDAFVDFPKKRLRLDIMPDCDVECPQCKGYGGWNLALNSYPLHFRENTAENRHKFSHFRACCSQCNGWGYVNKENSEHIHEWEWESNQGNCLNIYQCTICGKKRLIDSSD